MPEGPTSDESGLIAVARALGSATGKIAALVGASASAPVARVAKKHKLEKKERHRLPRRQKKGQAKLASEETKKGPGAV